MACTKRYLRRRCKEAGGERGNVSERRRARGGGGVTMLPEGREERPVRAVSDPFTDRPLIFFLALALVLGLAVGTQYVAWRFHYHPNLGTPLVVVPAPTARWLGAAGRLAAGPAVGGV